MSTYLDHLRPHLDAAGRLNDFIELRGDRIIFAGALDLLELVERYGSPLEVSFCPLISRRVHEMHAHFAAARARAGYRGEFVYEFVDDFPSFPKTPIKSTFWALKERLPQALVM